MRQNEIAPGLSPTRTELHFRGNCRLAGHSPGTMACDLHEFSGPQLFSSALLYNSSIFSDEGGLSMSNSGALGKPVAAMRRLASARS